MGSGPLSAGDSRGLTPRVASWREEGAFETVAPPESPWLCFPPGKEWAEPENTNFG